MALHILLLPCEIQRALHLLVHSKWTKTSQVGKLINHGSQSRNMRSTIWNNLFKLDQNYPWLRSVLQASGSITTTRISKLKVTAINLVIEIFKRREVYRHLSNAADRLARAGEVLHDIVVNISQAPTDEMANLFAQHIHSPHRQARKQIEVLVNF